MTLNAVGINSALTSTLRSQGLTSAKAQRVSEELTQSIQDSTDLLGQVDEQAARSKLDEAIAADVASGNLSEQDAATITKTLDEADQAAAASGGGESPATAASAGPAGGGGGGGGGGSEEKTELSRTVIVAGGIKTTLIIYTDGTSETKTVAANGAPDSKPDTTAADGAKAKDWLARIEPGTLIDKLA
jgi:hypothetical protein